MNESVVGDGSVLAVIHRLDCQQRTLLGQVCSWALSCFDVGGEDAL